MAWIPGNIRRGDGGAAALGADVVVRLVAGNETSLRHHFWEMHMEDAEKPEVVICSIILFMAGILCSAAGIGGGGIYVAVLMVAGGLTPHNAVPLSKAVVLFGALASLVVNLRRLAAGGSEPTAERHVIDFDACRVVVPASLIGTFIGVLLNWHTGDTTIVIVLTNLLVFMTIMVVREALKQQHEEMHEQHHRRGLPAEVAGMSSSSGGTTQEIGEKLPLLPKAKTALARKAATPSHRELGRHDVALASILLFVVILSGVLRFHMHACQEEKRSQANGKLDASGACNHPIIATLFAGHMEVWMSDERIAFVMQLIALSLPLWSCSMIAYTNGREAYQKGGWSVPKILAYQAVAVTTGTLAGLVGVGGGLIFSPFFLLTGMDPAMAVGTSSTCVLFTSSSTTIQYVFTDRIIMSLALVYGLVTLVASWTGTKLVHWLQDRFARRSHITWIVAMGVALSAALALAKLVGVGV
mmetsp:Transcript_61530/g.146797  ORF Transcript_61530/g.146797 Transcript_61530/m.146797 type:complete len:470 (-) Transcript_61530:156-1565(-)